MRKANHAATGIGSNAVWSLIKSVNEEGSSEGLLSKAQLICIPLRLDEDASTTREVSEEKAGKLVQSMKAYKQLMKILEVSDYRACVTSAMRDARNGKVITRRIEKETGIHVEIVDGRKEAHIVYDNHIEQLFAPGQNYLHVDVSGGSMEISLICGAELKNSRSYNIDTVRMLGGVVRNEEKEQTRPDLQVLAAEYSSIQIIGSGDSINKLFHLADKKDKRQPFLPVESLQEICETLKPLPKEEQIKQFKLKPDRAGVVVPVAEIFLEMAKQANAIGIAVLIIGLSDGITDSLYTKDMRAENDKR